MIKKKIAKFHQEVGRSSQYVYQPIIPKPKPLLKHDTSQSPLSQKQERFPCFFFFF